MFVNQFNYFGKKLNKKKCTKTLYKYGCDRIKLSIC